MNYENVVVLLSSLAVSFPVGRVQLVGGKVECPASTGSGPCTAQGALPTHGEGAQEQTAG